MHCLEASCDERCVAVGAGNIGIPAGSLSYGATDKGATMAGNELPAETSSRDPKCSR